MIGNLQFTHFTKKILLPSLPNAKGKNHFLKYLSKSQQDQGQPNALQKKRSAS